MPSHLLRTEVFGGADHRLQIGVPPRLVDGYLETLVTFMADAVGKPTR